MSTETEHAIPVHHGVPTPDLPAPVVAELEEAHEAAHAAVDAAPVEATPKPEPKPERDASLVTPKDTVDALRMIQREKLLQADDGPDIRKHLTNLVITWLVDKRTGETDQDWATWFTTADNDPAPEGDESEEDPT